MAYIDFKQLEQLDSGRSNSDFRWHSVAQSHTGHVRDGNEDAFFSDPDQGLWAVADGMGGLARGDYASGVVVETLVHFRRLAALAPSIRDLEVRLRDAHAECRNAFQNARVGSTVAVLYAHGPHVFFLWAGDSRIYRLRLGQLEQLTRDHTVAQEKQSSGELSAMQALLHPSANVLTRAVGVHQTLHLDLSHDTVEPGDRYLLCSDGLHRELPAITIEKSLATKNRADALDTLLEEALAGGGRDNVTGIVVDAS